MSKQIISTDAAPAAIGPYSQAVKVGNLLFLSGQIPLDSQSGQVVGQTAAEQVNQVMKNIEAVLKEAGASLDDVVKTTIFMVDLAEFQAVNAVYGASFPENAPARSTVQVSALPKGVRVEIEAVAVVK